MYSKQADFLGDRLVSVVCCIFWEPKALTKKYLLRKDDVGNCSNAAPAFFGAHIHLRLRAHISALIVPSALNLEARPQVSTLHRSGDANVWQ